MGNVNMEARQIHVRDNNKKTWKTVADALKGLEASGASVAEDITELYTRDASRASKDDIASDFDAETLYHTGDYVYYEGTLFKFTANHSGEWDPADVVIAQIGPAIANAGAVDYSTTEQPTGQKWINGKDIYFKTVEFGALPNNAKKSVDSGLTGETIIKMYGIAKSGNEYTTLPSTATNAIYTVTLGYDAVDHQIDIYTATDMTSYSGYVVLEYTKETT